MMTNVVAVRPNGMLLPTRFTIHGGQAAQREIDTQLTRVPATEGRLVDVSKAVVFEILQKISMTMKFDDDEFDWDAMFGLIDYYYEGLGLGSRSMKLLTITGRALDRGRSGDRTGISILGTPAARALVTDPSRVEPLLVLLQQSGEKDLGWSGYKFWWPILAAPPQAQPCVFASKTAI
jgi:hypothetical protein